MPATMIREQTCHFLSVSPEVPCGRFNNVHLDWLSARIEGIGYQSQQTLLFGVGKLRSCTTRAEGEGGDSRAGKALLVK